MKDLKVRHLLRDARNEAGVQTHTHTFQSQKCSSYPASLFLSRLFSFISFPPVSSLLCMFRLLVHPSLLTCQVTLISKTSPTQILHIRGDQKVKGAKGKCTYVKTHTSTCRSQHLLLLSVLVYRQLQQLS